MKKYLFAAAVLAAVAAPAAQAQTLQQMRNEFVSTCARARVQSAASSLPRPAAAP